MNPTYDVGYAKQKQYQSRGARRHIVEKTEDGWQLACTKTPSTREYRGFIGAVTCSDCRKIHQANE